MGLAAILVNDLEWRIEMGSIGEVRAQYQGSLPYVVRLFLGLFRDVQNLAEAVLFDLGAVEGHPEIFYIYSRKVSPVLIWSWEF